MYTDSDGADTNSDWSLTAWAIAVITVGCAVVVAAAAAATFFFFMRRRMYVSLIFHKL